MTFTIPALGLGAVYQTVANSNGLLWHEGPHMELLQTIGIHLRSPLH